MNPSTTLAVVILNAVKASHPNKSQNPAKSTALKKRHPQTAFYHPINHKLTTKTPRPNAKFPQNPQ